MNEKKGILIGITVFAILFVGFAYLNMRDQLSPATKVRAAEAETKEAEAKEFEAKEADEVTESQLINEEGILEITSELDGYGFPAITVKTGVPVKWTIIADEGDLSFCNNKLTIPSLDITKSLEVGENVIEFTPTEAGTIPYSCWMGMIQSSITVVDELDKVATDLNQTSELAPDVNTQLPAGGGCCAGAATN